MSGKWVVVRLFYFSLVAGFVLSRGALATEVLWLKLSPSFSYKDISVNCSTSNFPKALYFGAEVDGIQINAAVLKDGTFSIANQIAFQKGDLPGIELHQDSFGRLWVKKLTLSARLLEWVFTNASYALGGCKPSQPLKTVSPAPFAFAFNVGGLGESVSFSESPKSIFSGQRNDGANYIASMQWEQRRFEPSQD